MYSFCQSAQTLFASFAETVAAINPDSATRKYAEKPHIKMTSAHFAPFFIGFFVLSFLSIIYPPKTILI